MGRLILPGAVVAAVGVLAAAVIAVLIAQSDGSAMTTLPTAAYTGHRFPSPDPLGLPIRLLDIAVGTALVGALVLLLGLLARPRSRRAGA